MKRTILVALLLACGAAQASDWYALDVADNNAIVSVDRSSIMVVSGDVRKAWWKFIYQPQTVKDSGPGGTKWRDFLMYHFTFNCSEGTAKLDAMQTHYEDGTNSVADTEFMSTQVFEPVAPDTAKEAVMKFVCSWKPK
jgi:hypothetical protein